MSPHILLSYVISKWLGILQVNVPNLAAQAHIDAISLLPRHLEEDHEDKKMVSLKVHQYVMVIYEYV